jgi:hypothetical protein
MSVRRRPASRAQEQGGALWLPPQRGPHHPLRGSAVSPSCLTAFLFPCSFLPLRGGSLTVLLRSHQPLHSFAAFTSQQE